MTEKTNFDELSEMFGALAKAKEILGKEMWEKIRMKLVEGDSAKREAECLQELRRGVASDYLGMTADEYENHLETGSTKASKKIDDKGTIRRFLGL